MRIDVYLPFLFLIFKYVQANTCNIDKELVTAEQEHAHFSCSKIANETENAYLVASKNACIFTCKSNPFRFKHFCSTNGEWDVQPVGKSCSSIVKCADLPSLPNWSWSCPSPSFAGAKCTGICKHDPNIITTISCQSNGSWKVPNDLDDLCNFEILSCPKHWIKIRDNCYYFQYGHKNYENAISSCEKIGGILFEPKSQSTNSEVYHTLNTRFTLHNHPLAFGIWIGINDIDKEGEFVYTSSASPIIYENWYHGPFYNAPDNRFGDEDCVQYNHANGKPYWNDMPCYAKLPSICQLYS